MSVPFFIQQHRPQFLELPHGNWRRPNRYTSTPPTSGQGVELKGGYITTNKATHINSYVHAQGRSNYFALDECNEDMLVRGFAFDGFTYRILLETVLNNILSKYGQNHFITRNYAPHLLATAFNRTRHGRNTNIIPSNVEAELIGRGWRALGLIPDIGLALMDYNTETKRINRRTQWSLVFSRLVFESLIFYNKHVFVKLTGSVWSPVSRCAIRNQYLSQAKERKLLMSARNGTVPAIIRWSQL